MSNETTYRVSLQIQAKFKNKKPRLKKQRLLSFKNLTRSPTLQYLQHPPLQQLTTSRPIPEFLLRRPTPAVNPFRI